MKLIKFRAKIAATDVWIYGLPYAVYSDNYIDSIQSIETKQVEYIRTNTLGQFTGLKDKNGVEIYEGDKVVYTLNHDDSQKEIEAKIEWYNHAWRLNRIWLLTEIRSIKVVGDVY